MTVGGFGLLGCRVWERSIADELLADADDDSVATAADVLAAAADDKEEEEVAPARCCFAANRPHLRIAIVVATAGVTMHLDVLAAELLATAVRAELIADFVVEITVAAETADTLMAAAAAATTAVRDGFVVRRCRVVHCAEMEEDDDEAEVFVGTVAVVLDEDVATAEVAFASSRRVRHSGGLTLRSCIVIRLRYLVWIFCV